MSTLAVQFIANTFGNTQSTSFSSSAQDSFKSALDTASANSSNNNQSSSSNSTDNSYKKDDYSKKDSTTTNKDTTNKDTNQVSDKKVTKETTKPANGDQQEISEEDAIAMMATMLQIPQEQLVELLSSLDANVGDLFEDMGLLDTIISELYTFEDLVTDADLQQSIIGLKDLLTNNEFVIEEFVEEVDVEDVVLRSFDLKTASEDSEISLDNDAINQQSTTTSTQEIEVEVETGKQNTGDEDKELPFFVNQDVSVEDPNFNPFVNLTNAFKTDMAAGVSSASSAFTGGDAKPIMTQLIDTIQIVTLSDGKQITIDLDPESLGKLSLTVTENSGVIRGEIKVDSEKVKEMVLDQIEALKEAMEAQGLTVGEFNVEVKDQGYQEQMNHQKNKSNKRIEELLQMHLEELEAAEVHQEEGDIAQVQHDQNVNVKI
ncbi:MAG: hypothetical protein ATN35_08920 [Epulopiscium sp. Nele67-Bin004]|nr:MAG: hypothetical protein ATN35_08920 [Epulopiscium sp. Nele67-Bin004]